MFEQLYYDTLHALINFSQTKLGVGGGWQAEFGMTEIAGVRIAVDINMYEKFWGPIERHEITCRHILNNAGNQFVDTILLDFYSRVYDASGHERPHGRFGFPPGRPDNA